jgi:alanyl-tRNA synthetase
VPFIGRHVGDIAARELKPIAEAVLKNLGRGIVALVATADGKAAIITAVSEDLTAAHSAVDLVRLAAGAVGGAGGGGNKALAQAGGPQGRQWQAALDAVRTAIAA